MREALQHVRRYWEAYADRVAASSKVRPLHESFAELRLPHNRAYAYANRILDLQSLRGCSLLELGCGIGFDTVEFAQHGAEVTAIDLSPKCIALVSQILGYHRLKACLSIGDAEELPYRANSFDIVVARGILMYTLDDSRVVDEIFRVLKPRGQANILLHNRFSWYTFLAKVSGTNLYDPIADPPINRLYSLRQARQMFAKFPKCKIFSDRFPTPALTRKGTIAKAYNHLVVPCAKMLPTALLKPIGFYIIVQATK